MTTTTDLSKFGYREKRMAANLLTAMVDNGLPENFNDDEVTVMMNQISGNVFLTNSDYQVAMMNGDELKQWYSCPYDGEEGFIEELLENEPTEMNTEDAEYIIEIAKSDDIEMPENWLKFNEEN